MLRKVTRRAVHSARSPGALPGASQRARSGQASMPNLLRVAANWRRDRILDRAPPLLAAPSVRARCKIAGIEDDVPAQARAAPPDAFRPTTGVSAQHSTTSRMPEAVDGVGLQCNAACSKRRQGSNFVYGWEGWDKKHPKNLRSRRRGPDGANNEAHM